MPVQLKEHVAICIPAQTASHVPISLLIFQVWGRHWHQITMASFCFGECLWNINKRDLGSICEMKSKININAWYVACSKLRDIQNTFFRISGFFPGRLISASTRISDCSKGTQNLHYTLEFSLVRCHHYYVRWKQ